MCNHLHVISHTNPLYWVPGLEAGKPVGAVLEIPNSNATREVIDSAPCGILFDNKNEGGADTNQNYPGRGLEITGQHLLIWVRDRKRISRGDARNPAPQ
eukprot:3476267-Rhodomonas_salina.1